MIRYIKFKNFYSFKDEQLIDFRVSGKKSPVYYESYDGTQISKIAGFVGPNASGKTNAMRAFGFLAFFFAANEKKNPDFTPLKLYSFSDEKTCDIEVEFETNTHIFRYWLSIGKGYVVSERMELKLLEHGSRYARLYSRDGNGVTYLSPKFFTGVTDKNLKKLPKDVSVCAYLNANYDIDVLQELFAYFVTLNVNFAESGYSFTADEGVSMAMSMYLENPDIKEEMEEIIAGFDDVGIESFDFREVDENTFEIDAMHKVGEKTYPLSMDYESKGTKALFCEIGRILFFFKMGSIMVADEIETGLHPEAVNKLISFISELIEDEKKQFIFSSHSFEFMKKFDSQQIFLVEKEDNKSSVFRLDELKLRSEDNYYSKYLSGAYGAFPKIRI